MNQLEEKRSHLLSVTENLLKLFIDRQNAVACVFEEKKGLNKNAFVPEREVLVFKKLKPLLQKLSKKELFAFSLLIEAHAGADYPEWSEGVHLSRSPQKLWERINPVLLNVLQKEEFEIKDLNKKYFYLHELEI